MAHPSFYQESTTPKRYDTRLRGATKILGHYQNLGGALAANNPRRLDTFRVIRQKTLNAVRGTAYNG